MLSPESTNQPFLHNGSPVSHRQPSTLGQHLSLGMHCPSQVYIPATVDTAALVVLIRSWSPQDSSIQCPPRNRNGNAFPEPHLLCRHMHRPDNPCRLGRHCRTFRSVQRQTAGQSRSLCCPRHSWQSLAYNRTTQLCTRCRWSKWCCRRRSARSWIAGPHNWPRLGCCRIAHNLRHEQA